ncbi:saccharopine dehydrogenase NADP-binding domain-containing protein [Streptomyces sp. SID3343]|uniref:saccharopine dehydrogenase family protein n=1 Tax=Streptomyces sp. SID3343 TaxID=2690260 RepID=UPI00136DC928|nr:saccharopine dehydrogenase NADP-binding domain-containing protein [Streptomyces sp. SID3343]MYW05017.1 saccharopine dehydrogenase [Streptomyces sp. SID3343]
MPSDTRLYDIVLFGATGFTGELTAAYLARNAPADTRWALAGRNLDKLRALRERLAAIDPGCAKLALLCVEADDPAALREIAAASRVVATTVGPYVRYGGPLVAACAEAGTDYVDLCGEPEFVDRVYLDQHARAIETGARLVHACGFDSIPHDLGVLYTVGLLPSDVPIRVDGFVRASGMPSGGTFDSVLTAFSRSHEGERVHRARRAIEPAPTGRRVRIGGGPPRLDRTTRMWAVPLPTIDPQVVVRSAAALERYGPDFTYRHYAAVKHLPVALAGAVGLGALYTLARIPPAREHLLARRPPGTGPSPAARAKAWFRVLFVAETPTRRVVTEVAGGDPGYDETAKMLAESALSLAHDDLPLTAGQTTTAAALGQALISRLTAAGIAFRVVRDEARG